MQNVMFLALRAYYHIRQVIYKKKTCSEPPMKHEEVTGTSLSKTGNRANQTCKMFFHKNHTKISIYNNYW